MALALTVPRNKNGEYVTATANIVITGTVISITPAADEYFVFHKAAVSVAGSAEGSGATNIMCQIRNNGTILARFGNNKGLLLPVMSADFTTGHTLDGDGVKVFEINCNLNSDNLQVNGMLSGWLFKKQDSV